MAMTLKPKQMLKSALVKAARSLLNEQAIRDELWAITNRPRLADTDLRPINPWLSLWSGAATQTAEYIEQKMLTVPCFKSRRELFEAALRAVTLDGLYLEFGSGAEARSINFLAERIKGTMHGFDSFEGLPDAWFGENDKGSMTTHGQLPAVLPNVELHAGWFDQVLPKFVAEHPGPVAFMHVDCDLYTSTKTIFDALAQRIEPGTVIQFDEYFNYPGWKQHEYRAFQEFVEQSGMRYDYLGYTVQYSVAVVMH